MWGEWHEEAETSGRFAVYLLFSCPWPTALQTQHEAKYATSSLARSVKISGDPCPHVSWIGKVLGTLLVLRTRNPVFQRGVD